jgi:hypothetical protein
MITNKNSNEDIYAELKAVFGDKKKDYGVITSGSSANEESQLKFDKDQKGKPPIINKKISEK